MTLTLATARAPANQYGFEARTTVRRGHAVATRPRTWTGNDAAAVSGQANDQQYTSGVQAIPRGGGGGGGGGGALADRRRVLPGMRSGRSTATRGRLKIGLRSSGREPADDGGSHLSPATSTATRRASPVPEDTPWQSAGLSLDADGSPDLANGQPYVFEVRALNSAGPGAAASGEWPRRSACRVCPSRSLATEGDGEVVLEWTAPADDGGSPVTGYEYRYVAGDGVPDGTPWQDAGTELSSDRHGAGERDSLRVSRCGHCNRAGPGAAAVTTATPIRLEAELFSAAAVAAEGEPLVIGLRRSGGLAFRGARIHRCDGQRGPWRVGADGRG